MPFVTETNKKTNLLVYTWLLDTSEQDWSVSHSESPSGERLPDKPSTEWVRVSETLQCSLCATQPRAGSRLGHQGALAPPPPLIFPLPTFWMVRLRRGLRVQHCSISGSGQACQASAACLDPAASARACGCLPS